MAVTGDRGKFLEHVRRHKQRYPDRWPVPPEDPELRERVEIEVFQAYLLQALLMRRFGVVIEGEQFTGSVDRESVSQWITDLRSEGVNVEHQVAVAAVRAILGASGAMDEVRDLALANDVDLFALGDTLLDRLWQEASLDTEPDIDELMEQAYSMRDVARAADQDWIPPGLA